MDRSGAIVELASGALLLCRVREISRGVISSRPSPLLEALDLGVNCTSSGLFVLVELLLEFGSLLLIRGAPSS